MLLAIVGSLALAAAAVTQPSGDSPSITGASVAELQTVADFMVAFLREHKVPGAAVAVAKDSRLVYVRGFGMADVDRKTTVQPDSLFRIASISKLFTAAAVCRLVADGKLSFTDKVYDLLKPKPPP